MPQAIGVAIALAFGATVAPATATAIGMAVIMTGANFALGAVTKAIAGQPRMPDLSADAKTHQLTVRQPVSPWIATWGAARVGGIIVYLNVTGAAGEYLHIVVVHGSGEHEAVDAVYFDGTKVDFDGAGDATGKYAGCVHWEWRPGSTLPEVQLPYDGLVTATTGLPQPWTINERGYGHCHSWLRLKWSPDLFPGGVPALRFDVRGRKVHDPRTGLKAYSDNMALCVLDYLQDPDIGPGLLDAELDTAVNIAAANLCDEDVPLAPGGTQKRYTINGSTSVDKAPNDIVPALLASGWAQLVYSGGLWGIYPAAWREPSPRLLGDGDFRAPLKLETRVARRLRFNGVRGTYISAGKDYQPDDYPPYTHGPERGYAQDDYLAEDGERLWKDIDFAYVTDHARAQRLAKIALLEARVGENLLTAPCKLVGFRYQVPDVIPVQHARFGFGTDAATATVTQQYTGPTTSPWLDRTGWTITATHENTGYPAANALDGNTTSPWWSGANVPQSLVIDMQAPRLFDVIELRHGTVDYPRAANLYLSTDGVAWSPLALAIAGSVYSTGDSGASSLYVLAAAVNVRYIKIEIIGSSGSWVEVAEVNIGKASKTAPVLWSDYTEATGRDAAKAYDGSGATSWHGAHAVPVSLYVYFGEAVSLSELGITPGTSSGEGDYPTAVTLFVSNSAGTSWGTSIASASGWAADAARKALALATPVSTHFLQLRVDAVSGGTLARIAALDFTTTQTTVTPATGKYFQAREWRLLCEKVNGAPALGVDLALRETSPDVYTWTAADELATSVSTKPDLGFLTRIPFPDGIVLTSGDATALLRVDGVRLSRIKVTWNLNPSAYVQHGGLIWIEYRKLGDTVWLAAGECDGAATEAYIAGVDDNVTYEVQLCAESAAGVTSDWSPPVQHTVQPIAFPHASYRPTTNPLSAADSGPFPVVAVAPFAMRIAGVGDIALNAGSVNATSGDYGRTAFVFYDDPTFAGGTVVYQLTFTREVALGGACRFFVGSILLPAAGGVATVGNNDGGAGAQYSRTFNLLPSVVSAPGWTNPTFAIDENTDNYAACLTAGANAVLEASGFPAFSGWFTSDMLRVRHQFTSANGGWLEYSRDNGLNWTRVRAVVIADPADVWSEIELPSSQRSDLVRVRMTVPSAAAPLPSAYAGTAADAGAGFLAWANLADALGAPNTFVATATLADVDQVTTTNRLKLTGFGFAVPTGATIQGIAVAVVRRGTYRSMGSWGDRYGFVADDTVRLTAPGKSSADRAITNVFWPDDFAAQQYGGSNDLWAQTWSAADINSADFGVLLSASLSLGPAAIQPCIASVDSVQVTIYYAAGAVTPGTGRLYHITQEVSL